MAGNGIKQKHYESRFTRFYEGYWLIKKFGYDKRRAHFSSLILTGQMDREEALRILAEPPYPEEEAMEDMRIICEDMGISVDEFKQMMSGENKTYEDYKNSAWLIELAVRVARFLGVEKEIFDELRTNVKKVAKFLSTLPHISHKAKKGCRIMTILYDDLIERQEKLSVVGLGYVGMPIAVAFAQKIDVIGFDINQQKLKFISKERIQLKKSETKSSPKPRCSLQPMRLT